MIELFALLGYVLAARDTYVWCLDGRELEPGRLDALAVALAAVWPLVWATVLLLVLWERARASW